jgi:putative transposase
VFASGEHGSAFLDVLGEVCGATGMEVHSWCLLTDTYHLLVRTPKANLPQAMRQLNGQYAHWCRRDGRRDGPVFGRRYRSVLLDPDGWPLRVSRYINLQPQERGLVDDPLLYRWSSMRALAGRAEVPEWLVRDYLYGAAGGQDSWLTYVGYGVDVETAAFYGRQRISPVLGQPRVPGAEPASPAAGASMERIAAAVAAQFGIPVTRLYEAKRGRGTQATPRAVTMLLARSPGGHSLERIADALNVQHVSTVSVTVRRCRERLQKDAGLRDQVEAVTRRLQA